MASRGPKQPSMQGRTALFASWLTLAVMVAVPLVAAYVTTRVSDFGTNIEPDFMPVLAQVLPVVFIASFLENRSTLARHVEFEGPTTAVRRFGAFAAAVDVSWFSLGEGAALYGTATGTHSTFVVALAVATGIWALINVAVTAQQGVGARFRTFEQFEGDQRARMTRWMAKRLERLEDRADEARAILEDLKAESDDPHPTEKPSRPGRRK